MTWPLPTDFHEAVQNPATAFADPDLKAGQAVLSPTGLLLPRSGNFADVYQVRGPDGKHWGVKCFTRPVPGLAARYAVIAETLARSKLPFTIGFDFLAEGVRVGGAWRPAVKMEWVDGLLLNQVVRENAGRPAVLTALLQMWVKLCRRLRDAGVAHADLQHGNVILVPGSKPGTFALKLIDYDGMFVPELAGTPSGEVGHPNYQHPRRAETGAYTADLDRFPHLVVAAALAAVAERGPPLWKAHDTGDNLLFVEADFHDPANSAVMQTLWGSATPAVRALVGRLAVACRRPLAETPWLDRIAPDGRPLPLDDGTAREAAAILGPVAETVVVGEVIETTPVTEIGWEGQAPPRSDAAAVEEFQVWEAVVEDAPAVPPPRPPVTPAMPAGTPLVSRPPARPVARPTARRPARRDDAEDDGFDHRPRRRRGGGGRGSGPLDALYASPTNLIFLIPFGLCCGLVAFILSLVAFLTGKDPRAKTNAVVVLIVSGMMMVIGVLVNVVAATSGGRR